MYISNFNIKKIFPLLLLLIACTGCFRTNHQTDLKLVDGSDILLYQKDSTWMKVWGTMKWWNNYIIENDNRLNDSNFVRLDIRLRNLDTIILNNFNIKLWYVKNDILKEITEGRIYYDPESFHFDDYHQYQNMKDTFKNYTFINPSTNLGSLLVIKSKPSVEIEKADKFITNIYLDCKIDGEPIIIHKLDTLYKKKERMSGVSVH